VRDTPSVVLKLISNVVRVEQVDEVGMRTVNDKVKAKGLQKDLFGGENLARDFFDFLGERMDCRSHGTKKKENVEKRTGPLSGMSRTSIPFALDWHTLATSRSFLPHSSVFVARNIHAAAMV
jgi:hypothetical protein